MQLPEKKQEYKHNAFFLSMKKKIIIAILLLILLIIYLLLGNYLHLYIDCPIKKITGLYCPGCGITRMFLSLLKLDFYQAFRYNPLLFITLPVFLFFIGNAILTKKTPLYNKVPDKIWIVVIVLFIGYGVLRNIPFFDFLAPTLIK